MHWQTAENDRGKSLRDCPWHQLFAGLKSIGYEGFCLAKLHPPSPDPERIMRYYEGLWRALTA
jgi:sugar phosphate isomerase/epimerase